LALKLIDGENNPDIQYPEKHNRPVNDFPIFYETREKTEVSQL